MMTLSPTTDESRRMAPAGRDGVFSPKLEQGLEDLASLAAQICETPMALISCSDGTRQQVMAGLGLEAAGAAWENFFCAHLPTPPDSFLLVPDAARDERFCGDPLVAGEPGIRFYAALSFLVPGGSGPGTLCVMDRVPRELKPRQMEALRMLGRQAALQLELSQGKKPPPDNEPSRLKLEETLRLMRFCVDHNPAGVAMFDTEMKYLIASQQWKTTYRLGDQDLIGRCHYEVHTGQPERWKEAHRRCLAGAMEKCEEDSFLWEDGSMGWIRWEVWPWQRSDGSTGGIIIFSEDITERKQNEGLVQGQKMALESIAKGAPLGETLGELIRFIEKQSPGLLCSVLFLDPDGLHLRHGAAPSLPPEFSKAIDGAEIGPRVGSCGTAAFLREPVLVADIAADPLWAGSKELALKHGLAACWSTPIFDEQQQVLGTFALYYKKPGLPPKSHLHLVEIATQIAAIAISRDRALEALRQSQKELAGIIDSVDGIVWEADAKTMRFTFVSPRAERLLGFPASRWTEELTFWADHIHPEDREQAVRYCEKCTREGRDHEFEYRMLGAGGQTVWLRDIVTVVAKGDGSVRLCGIMVDITTQKLAGERIGRLNRTYGVLSGISQLIVRQSDPVAMLEAACRTAVDKGRFRLAWIGLAEEAAGELRIAAHAGATDEVLRVLRDMLEGRRPGCAFTLHALQTGQSGVCNDIAADPLAESWRNIASKKGYRAMAALPLKLEGKNLGTFNLYSDEMDFFDSEELRLLDELASEISFALEVNRRETKRRQAEEELRWRTAFFEAQVDSALDGILVVDSQGRQILQNDRLVEMWKLPSGLAAQNNEAAAIEFAAGQMKNPRQFTEKIAHLRSHPDEVSQDELELLDGRTFDRYSSPVRDKAGKHYGRIWAFRDITGQRQLEAQFRQAQKMEAIGQLAGGVAHDFNNILAAIMMQAELAGTEGKLPLLAQNMLNDIKAAAERAANLTRQLLAFSRRQVMQPGYLDLNAIVTDLAKMLRRILGEDVHFQLDLHPSPLWTRADAGMLDQVLLNLVVNARDAMPGGGKLIIETLERNFTEEEMPSIRDASPGRHVCLRVSDTGEGIKPGNLDRIFEPFFTTKEPGKGTGLGLATVFGIVKQHSGFLAVESQVGRGTAFQVYLRAEDPGETPAAEAAVPPFSGGGAETILLVEDDPSVRMLTQLVLERAGYRVLEATDGVKALQIGEQHRDSIRLLLTDIVMPEGVSGRELAARLQENNKDLQVIFTSGYSADVAGRELSLKEGQNFIQKPCSSGKLVEIVRRCLNKSKSRPGQT